MKFYILMILMILAAPFDLSGADLDQLRQKYMENLGRNDHTALEYADKMVHLTPSCVTYYYRSVVNLNLERFKEVIEDATRSLGKCQIYEAYVNRARAHMALRNEGSALQDLTMAIDKWPKEHKAYQYRAFLRTSTGKIEEAFDDMATAVALDPGLREFPVGKTEFDPKAVLKRYETEDDYFEAYWRERLGQKHFD